MNKMIFNLILLIIAVSAQSVCAQTELVKIRRAENLDMVQIYLTLTDLPQYSKVQKGKRIDIVVNALVTIQEEVDFAVDDRIVKFLAQSADNKTIFTFFLRYEPQKVELSTPQENTIVLNILLGNQFTKAYPDLSSKLQGVEIVKQKGEDYTNPAISSPYSHNWRSFFSQYEPDISTFSKVNFTKPPFPTLDLLPDAGNIKIAGLPEELFNLAQNDLWQDMLPLIEEKLTAEQDVETKKNYALTYGEILLRLGNFEGAFKQLYLLKNQYPEEPVGIIAAYLLILLRAEHEDVFIADYELGHLEEYVDEKLAISPYVYISQIELALATNQMDKVKQLLEKDSVFLPGKTFSIKELRQADYWFATREYIKAYVGYTLLQEEHILQVYPYSLNGYCDTLYRQKKYEKASDCYQQLISLTNDKEHLSTIALKKAMAEQHFKNNREMYVIYSTIEDTYAGTESGFRAAIKKTDIRYLSQPDWQKTSARYYKDVLENANTRDVAEEAALKEAIVYAELDDRAKSIELLMNFMRDFRQGKLKTTAQALLIEILPAEIEKLTNESKFTEALVLAKKNRELFHKNWIDINLLTLLAKAYFELGIYEEATGLYDYLLSTAGPTENEQYFLPLITIHFSQGNYDSVEDYSTQYNYNFPDGKDKDAIFLLRLKSLIAHDKNAKALGLVTAPLPDLVEIKEIAGALFFKENKFDKAVDILFPSLQANQLTSMDSKFILAESLFQLNRFDEAEQLFNTVKNEQQFFDQSRYRLAKIERDKGRKENTLKLLTEIVEKGNDPLWQKLAMKELQFQELAEKY